MDKDLFSHFDSPTGRIAKDIVRSEIRIAFSVEKMNIIREKCVFWPLYKKTNCYEKRI